MKLVNKLGIIGLAVLLTGCSLRPQTDSLGDDKRVPTIIVPSTFSSNHSAAWDEIERTLRTTKAPRVILYWGGFGGRVGMGTDVMNAMQDAEARGVQVIVRIVQFSASMHAIVPCDATLVTREGEGIMMFHLRSTVFGVDHSEGSKDEARDLMQGCVDKGIITEADVQAVLDGNELYVMPNGTKSVEPDKRDK